LAELLFDRRCRLTIAIPATNPKDFSGYQTTNLMRIDGGRQETGEVGFRVAFSLEKSLERTPNTGTITVTNLSADTRNSLQQKGLKVLFEAGYKNSLTTYFIGDVRTVDHVHVGPDWNTTMRLGDGERAWQFARVHESFNPGAAVSDVLRKLAAATGLKLGNVDKKAAAFVGALDQGWSASGNALKNLDMFVTRTLRKTLSVQNGALQLLDTDETLDHPVPDITPDSGLVGTPEFGSPPTRGKPQLITFTSLLIPVEAGARVRLRSEKYDGFVRVVKATHDGDTSGGNWYTKMDATVIR